MLVVSRLQSPGGPLSRSSGIHPSPTRIHVAALIWNDSVCCVVAYSLKPNRTSTLI